MQGNGLMNDPQTLLLTTGSCADSSLLRTVRQKVGGKVTRVSWKQICGVPKQKLRLSLTLTERLP